MDHGLLQIDRIRREIRTVRIGKRIEYVETTTSTNDEAWRHVDVGEADGLVVFSEYQSAGRGRLGRQWQAPRGAGLLCSVVLTENPSDDDDASRVLTGGDLVLLSAVAVCDAIGVCTDVTAKIKWPNDIRVSGRKAGGILVESRTQPGGDIAYVVGIGINCLQHEGHLASLPKTPATSLDLQSVSAVDRTALAIALLGELDRWLARPRTWSGEDLRSAWMAHAEPMGQRIRVQHAGKIVSGMMIDVDPAAALVVQVDEGGVRAFDAATTTVLPG